KKGNRENPQIMQLNDWVLESNQGSWHKPPEHIVWSEAQLQQGRDIIAQYAEFPCWGFKDPRALITLEGWRQLLPQMEFVGIFRHPALVARSINARNENLSLEAGLDLWVHYNTRLLALLKQAPFPLLHFAPVEIDMLHSVRSLARVLDLPYPERIDFYDAALVNQEDWQLQALSPRVDELYTALKELAQ
ncbi:MAG: sulfotransferase family protein, partial [Pseudomonadales bacterium]|nr:sulfotransferase family protein [Pseudomonadales bacterium]